MADLAEPDLAAGPSKGQISATCVASSSATIAMAVRTEMEVARLEELDLRRNATTAMRQATSCETADDHCGTIARSQEGRDDIKEGSSSSVEDVAEASSMERIGSKEDNSSRMPCRVPTASDLGMSMKPAL